MVKKCLLSRKEAHSSLKYVNFFFIVDAPHAVPIVVMESVIGLKNVGPRCRCETLICSHSAKDNKTIEEK